MIFSERGTAEYRLHTASTNTVKLSAWLFICAAITKYSEANVEKILAEPGKVSLIDVLNYYKDHFPRDKNAAFLSEYLIAYYNDRCEAFTKDLKKEDHVSEWDIKQDKQFTFEYEGVTLFS